MDLADKMKSLELEGAQMTGLGSLPPELLKEILELSLPDGFISAALSCKAMYTLAQPMIQRHNELYQVSLHLRRLKVDMLCHLAQCSANLCNVWSLGEEPRLHRLIELQADAGVPASECLGSKIECEIDDLVDQIYMSGRDLIEYERTTLYFLQSHRYRWDWLNTITRLDRSLAVTLPIDQYFARRTLRTRYRLFGFAFLALLRGLKTLTIEPSDHIIYSQAGELANLVCHWQGSTYFQHLQQLRICQNGYPDASFVLTSLLQLPSLEILQLEDAGTSFEQEIVYPSRDGSFARFRAPLRMLILYNMPYQSEGLYYLMSALPYLYTCVVNRRNLLYDPDDWYLSLEDWQAKFEPDIKKRITW